MRHAAMPIVVGAPRSGTTLLRFMLDAHPDLAIPPETGFLPACAALKSTGGADALRDALVDTITGYPPEAPGWHDFQIPTDVFRARLAAIEPFTAADGVRAFYELYAARFGKPRWGDKTPLYGQHLEPIARLLPEAHFVHIIRDGRDVALSLRPMWFSPGRDIETLATEWRRWVSTTRAQGSLCAHYTEVRYEQLVERTPEVLRDICAFIGLEYNERMLRYHERTPDRLREHQGRVRSDGTVVVSSEQRLGQQRRTMQPPDRSRVFAWKREMDAEEQRRFEAIAGDLLTELGFDYS